MFTEEMNRRKAKKADAERKSTSVAELVSEGKMVTEAQG